MSRSSVILSPVAVGNDVKMTINSAVHRYEFSVGKWDPSCVVGLTLEGLTDALRSWENSPGAQGQGWIRWLTQPLAPPGTAISDGILSAAFGLRLTDSRGIVRTHRTCVLHVGKELWFPRGSKLMYR